MLENNLGKRPLFSVGEEVILQSIYNPQCNGDAVVNKVKIGVRTDTMEPSWVYDLSIKHPDGIYWAECALRKKHKPSEHSFGSLMAGLKSKEPRNVKA